MADAAEIVQRWRKRVPPEVPKEDVLKVVEAYFPGSYELTSGSSHFLIVKHEALRIAHERGFSASFPGGRLSLSHTRGRYVKKYLIQNLLEAIDVREAFDRVQGTTGEAGRGQ
ncbi:MAG: hypothetical protein HY320_04435 [Armatimonadetes bacterium]|nr:hypothetical protein [Armatimonadota bacterium]